MAGGHPWRLYHGPAKRQLLCGLLLGSHEPNVCCRGDEPAMDGRYRRLRFSGEGGPWRSMGESDIRAFAYIMGNMDVDGGAGLTPTVWFRLFNCAVRIDPHLWLIVAQVFECKKKF